MRFLLYFSGLLCACNSFYFPNLLPQFNYQIGCTKSLKGKPIKIVIDNNNLCLFKDQKTKEIKLVDDCCQHRYSSLSEGWLGNTTTGKIFCNYHGLGFYGNRSPGLTSNLKIVNDAIFFSPGTNNSTDPFFPPEEYDKTFRCIEGSCKLDTNVNVFLENVIDILHISTVHVNTFGQRGQMPENLRSKRLSDVSYQQSFTYKPGEKSLSNQIQKIKGKEGMLQVENEYHLPNNVLSRVNLDGKDIKTVWVTAYPINDKETIIFWKLYRNFIVFDFEPLNILGDILFKFLFELALAEDKKILDTIYLKRTSKQFHTKYDRIQKEFRNDLQKYKIKGIIQENIDASHRKNKCECSEK
jgi:phenylpropionate dioxygenase-like ring-hydroxylating dioxygenase large terminal subunit